jgi:tetratricopeptide (TPR) repeat protein
MTSNDAAQSAFDHVVEGYLGVAVDTGERLGEVFKADADMLMAHVLKGYFFLIMGASGLKKKAADIAANTAKIMHGASPREQLHVRALTAWSAGRLAEAIAVWDQILQDNPRDILALRLCHHGYFYKGDSQNVRDVVARNLHAWDDSVPGYGFVMGMRAFGLEETHAYGTAIEAGRMALDINPNDPWAIHAVAHVYEMTDRPAEGIAWITDHEPGWTGANNFRNHLYWHRALMRLDRGEYAEATAVYDDYIWDPESTEYLDFCNYASLLMRLELHGQDVRDRWQALAETCKNRTDEHILAFADTHFAMALGAADASESKDILDSLRTYASESSEDNADITAAVGLPLAEALVAYHQGDYAGAVDQLHPIRYDLHYMGGSHAQRDLFAMLLIDAALKAGRVSLARSLTAERLCRMPENAWSHGAYDRAFAA